MEHRDRLACFGVEYLEGVFAVFGRRLVVLDPQEATGDLVRDITEVLTLMCAWLSGQRAGRNRAGRVIAVATGEATG